MPKLSISRPHKTITGHVKLDGSKSISNRVLIIQALTEDIFDLEGLGKSDDISRLQHFFSTDESVKDAGPAGTTFRFSTAYYAIQPGEQILTGSERMKQRPIGALVDTLRSIGANIEYIEKEGYPPLKIGEPNFTGQNKVRISADTSSQFITAMLLIAPALPNGLTLELEGQIVSMSYIEMTLNVMRHFGAEVSWEDNNLQVAPKPYQGRDYIIEADWSAASYYYAIAALADKVDLRLGGLSAQKIQGDSILPEMMTQFGIETQYGDNEIHLIKESDVSPELFEWDFDLCPDIAQTLAVICAAKGIRGLFSGLHTLSIKETDRIAALKNELAKVQVSFAALPKRFSPKSNQDYYMIDGEIGFQNTPTFDTYHDHRMAMAFAPLAMLHPIDIDDPQVVIKSYPAFWQDLASLGFEMEEIE